MDSILYLSCPCSSFPRSFARDYKETYRYPPPSTLYGLLLSWVGEEDLATHLGLKLAIGIVGEPPPISRIIRKQRHHKFSRSHLGTYPSSKFSKPNHQELLTDIQIAIRLDSSQENASTNLEDRINIAMTSPEQIHRFGGLSLGESWALVNGIRHYRETDGEISWLTKDDRGLISLPVWIDRKTGRGTFQRFSLAGFEESCWTSIHSPSESGSKPKTPSSRKKKS